MQMDNLFLSKKKEEILVYRKIVLVLGNLSVYVDAEKPAFKAFIRRMLLPHFADQMQGENHS